MITSADEYLSALFKIYENGNIPSLATLLPDTERIYNIDLNSRTVEAPEFLSVTDDHVSETVYFLVDRFFDNIDMSTTGCVIQYINANNEGRIYSVPFYDIETYHAYDKMLIPWCIEGEATKAAGEVTYSIRFFKIDPTGKYITFVLNTIPQKSKILQGMNILDGYIQVVGHTTVKNICNTKTLNSEFPEIWLCDNLPKEYLVIEDNKFIIKQYEESV